MACKADTMDVELASAVQKEMVVMVREEEALREKIKKMVCSSYVKHKFSTLIEFSDGRVIK